MLVTGKLVWGCISLLLSRLPSSLTYLNSIDGETWAVWAVIKKYSLSSEHWPFSGVRSIHPHRPRSHQLDTRPGIRKELLYDRNSCNVHNNKHTKNIKISLNHPFKPPKEHFSLQFTCVKRSHFFSPLRGLLRCLTVLSSMFKWHHNLSF